MGIALGRHMWLYGLSPLRPASLRYAPQRNATLLFRRLRTEFTAPLRNAPRRSAAQRNATIDLGI
jgi:hypothetical protein